MKTETYRADVTEEARECGLEKRIWKLLHPAAEQMRVRVRTALLLQRKQHRLVLEREVILAKDAAQPPLRLLVQLEADALRPNPLLLEAAMFAGIEPPQRSLADFGDPDVTVHRFRVDLQSRILALESDGTPSAEDAVLRLKEEERMILEEGRKRSRCVEA